MGKNKLKRFKENETFERMYQPILDEVFNVDYKLKGNWNKDVFKNNNPIVLELGCGRGEYSIALAKKYPEKNFIGIDIKGARLWRGAKTANDENILNAAYLRLRIEFITNCFAENEVSEIWVTFPDPQIKKAKKRLTSSVYLSRYAKFLKPDATINLKTDSQLLHEYTKSLALENKFEILEASNNIYTEFPDNDLLAIKTHYEQQYLSEGKDITYIKFIPKGNQIVEPQNFDEDSFS